MTVHKTRERDIRHSRIPLPEIYSLSEAFRIAYADETGAPGVAVVPALGGVEVGWIAVPLGPGNLVSWLVFERISRCAAIPDTRFGNNIHDPMQWLGPGVLIVPLKGYGYSSRCKCTRCSLMDSHPMVNDPDTPAYYRVQPRTLGHRP